MKFINELPEKRLLSLKQSLSLEKERLGKYALYLMGSWARGEGVAWENTEKIVTKSDVEFYVLFEESSARKLLVIQSLVERVFPEFEVDISGTNLGNFMSFQNRLWLYDLSQTAVCLQSTLELEDPFQKFGEELPCFSEFLHLGLNCYYQYYTNEASLYYRAKMWRSLGTLVLFSLGFYSPLFTRRKEMWNDLEIKGNIQSLQVFSENPALFQLLDTYMNLEWNAGELVEKFHFAPVEDFLIKQILAFIITQQSGKIDCERDAAEAYFWFVKNHIATSREWVRSFYRHPFESFFFNLNELPPRYQTYYQMLKSKSFNLETLSNSYAIFCKGA